MEDGSVSYKTTRRWVGPKQTPKQISVNRCQPQVEVKVLEVLVVIGSHGVGPRSDLHKFTPTSDGTSQTLYDV